MRWLDTLAHLVRRTVEAQQQRERIAGRTEKRVSPPTRRVAHGVRVEYSPDLDGDADPGEVVWAWVPFEEDPHRGKDRPVVVIGRVGDDLAAVPLTSKNKRRDDQVPVGTGAWDSQRRPSYARVDRLITVDPGDVRREGAVLAEDRFDEVVAHVGRYHDLVHP